MSELNVFKFHSRDDQNCYYQKNNDYIFSKRINEPMSDLRPYQNCEMFSTPSIQSCEIISAPSEKKESEGFIVGLKKFLKMT